jgi:hypothetical protein
MGYLQDQAVMNFAGTAARGSAIGSAVSQGMVSYLDDSNGVEVYRTTGTAIAGWERIDAPLSPNVIINGAFEINQRGFTSNTTGVYGFDRWRTQQNGGTVTQSSQAFTLGSAPASSREAGNFLRIVTSGQSAAGDFAFPYQPIESVRTLAGQTVTVSFWARAGSGTPKVSVELNQFFGSNGSPSPETLTLAGQVTLSTTFTRYSVTTTIPSLSGKTIGTLGNDALNLAFWVSAGSNLNSRTGSLGIQNNTFDFWGVQLEAGQTATPFRRNANSIQGELAACQRYYYQMGPQVTGSGQLYVGFGLLQAPLTTVIVGRIQLPVKMRTTPSSVLWTGTTSNYAIYTGSGAISGSPSIGGDRSSEDSIWISWPGSGFTSGAFYFLTANNTTAAYLGFSAEL